MTALCLRDFKNLSSLCLSISLSGCVWSNFKAAPVNANAIGQPPGPVATLQNLDGSEFQMNAIEAIKVAGQVVKHQEFILGLQGKELRPKCPSDDILSDDLLSGDQVYDSLKEAQTFSLVAKKPWLAIAVADISKRRVAIRKSRFKNWNGSVEQRGELIETLVHEMTHMIPEITEEKDKKRVQSRYKDDGHGTTKCPDLSLVSYYVGDLAKRVYIANHQDFIY